MSRDGRKPWETPVQYNDDRWAGAFVPRQEPQSDSSPSRGPSDNGEERDARDVEEILRRPERQERDDYECNDVTPVNYQKGPHDEVLGVEDSDFDEPDTAPLNYDSGPHDEEFGVEDDELEPLGDEAEFPEI